jgi:hypothetical protein
MNLAQIGGKNRGSVPNQKRLPQFILTFLTVASTMSPQQAAGSLFNLPLMPDTAITYRFLPPNKQIFLF